MSQSALRKRIEEKQLRTDMPRFCVGDTVRVHIRIAEGEKERIQVFTGIVIARRGGGLSETFAVYRAAYGSGIEKVFLVHSPRIAKIEVTKKGRVRRAKLYYLRGAKGKAARVRGEALTGQRRKVGAASRTTGAVAGTASAAGAAAGADQNSAVGEPEMVAERIDSGPANE